MFELLVPAEKKQLERIKGDKKIYDLELRPKLMVQTVNQLQDAAAIDINDKLADAGQVHAFTGFCPSVALHVLWDFLPDKTPADVVKLAQKYGVRVGAINPNLFQDQIYKYGSLCNRDQRVRNAAVKHLLESAELAKQTDSQLVAIWLADGSNYPGTLPSSSSP